MSKTTRFLMTLGVACLAASVAWAQTGGAPAGLVGKIKVLPDKAPDCSSLKAIAESVTRGCKTNDEKAIAVYNFMLLSHYHLQYPGEKGGIPVLKEINTYGWSLCGGLHSEQSAIWRELGWKWRFVGWSGHTTVEAQYDGRWHYLDAFLKFYAWMPDPTDPSKKIIAGEDDLNGNSQELIADAFVLDKARNVVYAKNNQFQVIDGKANWRAPEFLSCGDGINDVIGGLKTHKAGGADEGWAGINHATGNYSADINLAPGMSLTQGWDPIEGAFFYNNGTKAPKHTCGNKDTRNNAGCGMVLEPYFATVRSYANGNFVFAPDFSSDACLKSFTATDNVKVAGGALTAADASKPASVTVQLLSPYIITVAKGAGDGVDSFELSTDGKTFAKADLADFTAAAKGQVGVWARIGFKTLKSLKLDLTVQDNPGALPFLSPGKNSVDVTCADAKALGDNKLVVTMAYRLGSRTKSFEQLYEADKEVAKMHNAKWSDDVTYVQKIYVAKDLPAKFEVDIPTPKGQFPVYPRMMFVRREIIAANSKPMALPDKAVAATPAAADELVTLPNPFLLGTEPPPPPAAPRAVKSSVTPLVSQGIVSKKPDSPRGDFIKWAKDDSDAWVLLIGGELKNLPAGKDLAAARLVFTAVRAHEEAPTKVGVCSLKAPFKAGEAFDFKNIGEVAGALVLPKTPKDQANWDPPKEFKIECTKAIKAVCNGEAKFNGLALRTVPDKATDDGWSVRVSLPKDVKVSLELDVYDAAAPAPAPAPAPK